MGPLVVRPAEIEKKTFFGGHFGGLQSIEGFKSPKIETRARNPIFVIFVTLSIFFLEIPLGSVFL